MDVTINHDLGSCKYNQVLLDRFNSRVRGAGAVRNSPDESVALLVVVLLLLFELVQKSISR